MNRRVPVALGWLALLLAAVAGAAPGGLAPLPERGYVWTPELAPQGPVLIVVGIAEQRAHVYRNGVRIGSSAASTGKPGHETPTGVFSILEKRREHYSNLYDAAPMPFMQRLTWDGVALHAGRVPGYPASHGCVRLPYEFSEKLFGITARGMTVVVADSFAAPTVVSPGLFGAAASADEQLADSEQGFWAPERATDGPLAVVLSTHDQALVVLRNAVEIGRAPVVLDGAWVGSRAYVLLAGTGPGPSRVVPDRPARRWLEIPLDEASPAAPAAPVGDLRMDPDFARQVYDLLVPGTTLLVTDEALRVDGESSGPDQTVITADRPGPTEPEPADSTPLH